MHAFEIISTDIFGAFSDHCWQNCRVKKQLQVFRRGVGY